jgi:hypothetical protein
MLVRYALRKSRLVKLTRPDGSLRWCVVAISKSGLVSRNATTVTVLAQPRSQIAETGRETLEVGMMELYAQRHKGRGSLFGWGWISLCGKCSV